MKENAIDAVRLRRLRSSEGIRRLVRETSWNLDQLVMPYFVDSSLSGKNGKAEIESMPGQYRFSIEALLAEVEGLIKLGINSILLFGLPKTKNEKASEAFSASGVVQKAVKSIKKNFPQLVVITDVCLCAYTSHGHCGVVDEHKIHNKKTLPVLAEIALSHAEAGADIVAPSDMMDGRVRAIRNLLDEKGFDELPIMSYSAKYASSFYGPFRDAAHSAPSFGDRRTYQMDPYNKKEALREIRQDIHEGADIVMVKPALAYLDIIRSVSDSFKIPVAAYSVSGEYSMVKAAAKAGLIHESAVVEEMTASFFRSGANILISYFSKDLSAWKTRSFQK